MIRRVLSALLALILLAGTCVAESADEVIPEPTLSPEAAKYDTDHPENLEADQLYALSAILITGDTGEIIFEKNPYEVRYPASTTKILTVLLGCMLIEDPEETVIVSETAMDIPSDSSTMGLKAGEEIRFIDVLYGTMLLSGNDGANVIAETISGNIPEFVDLMNRTAEAFGCVGTHFANAHGYHDDNHYSTAYDIALITRFAMENDLFRQIAGTTSYNIPRTNIHRARTITTKSEYMLPGTEENPNKYYYPDATGVKTGSHSRSGYCFVGSASREGVDLISVVLFTGKRARWADTIKLMNYGFSQYVSVSPMDIYNMNPITIETSSYSTSDTNRGKVDLLIRAKDGGGDTRITATKTSVSQMANDIKNTFLIQYTRDFIAPITAGEVIGELTYYPETGEPVSYNLVAGRSVAVRENAPKTLEQIVAETESDPNPFPPFNFEFALVLLVPVLVLAVIFFVIRHLRKKRRNVKYHTPKPVNRYVK